MTMATPNMDTPFQPRPSRRISTFPTPPPPQELRLGISGFRYADLHDPAGLERLFEHFSAWFAKEDAEAHAAWSAWRVQPETLGSVALSALLVRVAPFVGRYLAQLFAIERESERLSDAILADQPLFDFRKNFLKKRVLRGDAGKGFRFDEAAASGLAALVFAWGARSGDDEEMRVARSSLALTALATKLRGGASDASLAALKAALHASPKLAALWDEVRAEVATLEAGDEDRALVDWLLSAVEACLVARHRDPSDSMFRWTSMYVPHKHDFEALVPLRRKNPALPEQVEGPEEQRRQRSEPFALTDRRGSRREVAREVDYCIYCHERDKDSCSKGLRDKQGAVRKNPLGVDLKGCPLDEKIGEMHQLRLQGEAIAALAVVAVDNPMMPGTGHRICNDCMKACVYQKQEPVNIPLAETRVLEDVNSMERLLIDGTEQGTVAVLSILGVTVVLFASELSR